VEVIHILCDEKSQLAQVLQFDQGAMTRIRLDRSKESEFGWKIFVLSRPSALGSSDIGHAGFSTDARPRQEDDVFTFKDPLGQFSNSFS
jgi:hypothetical protein